MMSMMRWLARGAMGIGVGVVGTVIGCMGGGDEEATGVAQVAITQVPFDGSVGCVAVTATGAFSVTKSIDVSPGSSSVLPLHGLPTGTVSFTGNAYAGPCSLVTPASVPTWISDPTIASVSHVPVLVTLVMKRNGQANVGVDFQDPSCRATGAPCLSPSECCSGICAGNACQGTCQPDGIACATNADCCSSNCQNGVCQPACVPGDGGCICTPLTCAQIGFNCGLAGDGCGGVIDCGTCPAGQLCGAGGQPGVCAFPGCPPPFVMCGSACIDISSDPQNCGFCGGVCPPGAVCAAGACLFGPTTCTDGIKDGFETDVDCGGNCPPCGIGQSCIVPSECQSGVCANNVCQAPSCVDGIKNGFETDIDCGGGLCPACAVGRTCNTFFDCQSGLCLAGLCQPPSCFDAIKNGAETDVDCGGPNCAPCATGRTCLANVDCASGFCAGGICQ
jgi:hypothetical protein